jgi:Acetoacetate decarboxylase (ADC)
MTRTELTGVAGVPETAVSDALLQRLPANGSPAPWECVCEAVVWFGHGGRAARQALPPALREVAAGLAVVGGIVRYLETPVGPYDEVLGMVGSRTGLKPWGSVAFMSVDSEPSLVGGRANWAMPKTLGTFAGDIGNGRAITAAGADENRWRVSATPRVLGPAVPVRSRALARQEFPGGVVGDSALRARGRVRPAVVTVTVESDGLLAAWLRPGRHLGAVVERATFTLAEPRF